MPVLSDETYDQQLAQLRQMDPATIRQLLLVSEKIKIFYEYLENKLGNRGIAKYLLLSVVITILIVIGLILWRIFGFLWSFVGSSGSTSDAATTSASMLPAEPLQAGDSLEGEFEF